MGSAHGDQAGSRSHRHSTHESPRSYVSWQAFYHVFQQTLAANSILQPLFFDPAVIHEARPMNGTTSHDLGITCVVTSRSTEPYRCLGRTMCIFGQDAAFLRLNCNHTQMFTYTYVHTHTHTQTHNISSTIEQAYSSVETQNSQHDRDEPRGDSGHTSFTLETQEPSLAFGPTLAATRTSVGQQLLLTAIRGSASPGPIFFTAARSPPSHHCPNNLGAI